MKSKSTPADAPPVDAPPAGSAPLPRQLGANHSDTAKRPRKHHNNFKQSTDLREDRGIRQLKSGPKAQSSRGGR